MKLELKIALHYFRLTLMRFSNDPDYKNSCVPLSSEVRDNLLRLIYKNGLRLSLSSVRDVLNFFQIAPAQLH